MAGMQAEIQINQPVEAVYGFFLDLERNIEATDPTVESVVKVTEGPIGPGTRYRLRQPVLGKVREQTMWITAVDPNRRIDMEAAFGPVRPQFSLAFEATTSGTRVTFAAAPDRWVLSSWSRSSWIALASGTGSGVSA